MRVWSFGSCEYDEEERRLWIGGKPLKLGDRVLDLLEALLKAPGHKCTSIDLSRIWGSGGSIDSVKDAVRQLRRAIEQGGISEEIIVTLRGIGFQIAVLVAERNFELSELWRALLKDAPAPGLLGWKLQLPLEPGPRSRVWQVKNEANHQIRVVKYATDPIRRAALRREVRVWEAFERGLTSQKSFARIFSSHLTTRPCYVESEYGGLNLLAWSETQRSHGGLSREVCLQIMTDLAEAVATVHSFRIVHNDLKPANVLISPSPVQGGRWQVKVADFGVASVLGENRLAEFQLGDRTLQPPAAGVGGTSLYQAPEVGPGRTPTLKADVYALGVIFFQLLCGDYQKTPYPGWEQQIGDPILQQDIEAACNVDAARRPEAHEFAECLRTVEERRQKLNTERKERLRNERDKQQFALMRARRPWVICAVVALCLGLGASLWFALRAAHARDLAEKRNAILTEMNGFFADDLLGQTNPLTESANSGPVEQETLVAAIDRVLPIIDSRFRDAPEIAGQLHMAAGAALDARTQYAASAKEFANASERFRQAEGPLSQNAIIAALRGDNAEMRTGIPTNIAQAKTDLSARQKLIGQVHDVSPLLQSWYAFGQSGNFIYSPHPEEALPLLGAAIQRAKAIPGFNARLLSALEIRIGAVYLTMNEGERAERAEREAIAALEFAGTDNLTLATPRLFLEEALDIEGKFRDAIAVGTSNYSRVKDRLGPQNQLTMAIRTNTAQAEGALENYDDAIRDELALNKMAKTLPSARYLQEDTLSDVALDECRSARFHSGMEHAQQIIRESSGGATALPLFVNLASFAQAECLLAQEEAEGRAAPVNALDRANALLKGLNIPLVQQHSGEAGFQGACDVEGARLALLRGQTALAKEDAAKAAPFMARADADAYERRVLTRVRAALAR